MQVPLHLIGDDDCNTKLRCQLPQVPQEAPCSAKRHRQVQRNQTWFAANQ